MKKKIFAVLAAVLVVAIIALSGKLFEDADKSKNYVCQMPITGEYVVWNDGGLQWQGLGDIDSYDKTSQIEFSDLEKNERGHIGVSIIESMLGSINVVIQLLVIILLLVLLLMTEVKVILLVLSELCCLMTINI